VSYAGVALRRAMSEWPSGVAVLAVQRGAYIEAITVNSYISVSLEPPLVLVSISKHAQILGGIPPGARYSISALAASQARVASMVIDRFPNLKSIFSGDDVPGVTGALFTLICTTSHMQEAGDHVLHIGTVERVVMGEPAQPLLYHRGAYLSLPS